MDTSEDYIKMCEKAEEIQRHFSDVDNRIEKAIPYHQYSGQGYTSKLYAYGYEWEVAEHTSIAWGEDYPSEEVDVVWLPQQDQLQEMLQTTHLINPFNLIGFLYNILNEDKTCPEEVPCEECIKESLYWCSFKTMEQLWLAFVMKEKYDKEWSEDKWT